MRGSRYSTAAEAAALLGVSRSSLYAYVSRGRIHAESDPRNPRVSRYLTGDPQVRFQASAGGGLSALAIYLLEKGEVDFILHVAASREKPMRSERHLSFDRAQVLAGAGSRYGPAAPLTDFVSLLEHGRPFAVIAKPCDLAAIRNLFIPMRQWAAKLWPAIWWGHLERALLAFEDLQCRELL